MGDLRIKARRPGEMFSFVYPWEDYRLFDERMEKEGTSEAYLADKKRLESYWLGRGMLKRPARRMAERLAALRYPPAPDARNWQKKPKMVKPAEYEGWKNRVLERYRMDDPYAGMNAYDFGANRDEYAEFAASTTAEKKARWQPDLTAGDPEFKFDLTIFDADRRLYWTPDAPAPVDSPVEPKAEETKRKPGPDKKRKSRSKKPSMADIVWIAENMSRAIADLEEKDAPSAIAWSMFKWAKVNPTEFWKQNGDKIFGTKKEVEAARRGMDDGASQKSLIDELETRWKAEREAAV